MPIFRKIIEKDIAQVAALEKKTFSDAWSEASIRGTYGQAQAFITVAEVDGTFAGYCIVYYVMDEAEIARIAVDESFRRQGIGQGLLSYTFSCCEEKQIERVLLDVRESNVSARAFYQKQGFLEDGIRKDFYNGPKEHAVLMSRSISNLFH